MLDGSPSACEYWAVNTPKTIKQNKEFIGFMENQTVGCGGIYCYIDLFVFNPNIDMFFR